MSFTYDLTTSIGKIRLELGDTDSGAGKGVKPDGSNFTDEELQTFIDTAGTWARAAVKALRTLASMYAVRATREQVADVRLDLSQVAKELRAQADALEATIDADGEFAERTVMSATLDMSDSYYSVQTDYSIE